MSVACVTLQDPSSPATATIAVGFGFNCFRFTVERNGKSMEVLWSAPDFAAGTARPSGSGIPLLFPFPGRIRQGQLSWGGKQYALPQTDGRGNAIHGFVLKRPWRVVDQQANRVTGEFQASVDDPSLLELWPADFRIRATYALEQATLSCRLEVDNPDRRPLPCGLGTHPYFRIPLGGDRGDACLVSLPVSTQWELAELLPTGRRLPLEDAAALQAGVPFGDMKYDNVFSGLQWRDGWCRSRIYDPTTRVTVEQSFDNSFRECVVFTPPHREAICIEPLTCVPGPFELTEKGIDGGLRILEPGASFTARINVAVR